MKNIKTNLALAGVLSIAMSGTASAAVLFMQDFETGPINANGFNDAVASTHSNNWGRHHEDTNLPLNDAGLSGYVMGHIGPSNGGGGTTNYASEEQSIYTIQLDFTNVQDAGLQLMFDYDSWIYNDDIDGFSVVAYTGAADTDITGNNSWDLLEPTTDGTSDMRYETLNDFGGSDNTGRLDETQNGERRGFNGSNSNSHMDGIAMFDLSGLGLAGNNQVNLRFAFGSGSFSSAEGINIDNIKITGEFCPPGTTGPDCDSGSQIPEPASLALGVIGLAALYRRRKS